MARNRAQVVKSEEVVAAEARALERKAEVRAALVRTFPGARIVAGGDVILP